MQRVIDSGVFTMGTEVGRFEHQFCEYLDTEYAVMVNSGSSANLLMVAALFYRLDGALVRGDEVIVPAVSWSTTFAPLQQMGLHVKFVDIEPKTLNLDVDQVEAAVTDRTRLIFAVNLLGNPADLPRLQKIANSHSLILLEDNCESLGASLDGKLTGTWGLMGSFSSFFSHHISTMEGGLVVTDDEELYHIMLSLRAHGWTRQLPSSNKLVHKTDDPFYESFRFVLPGFNFRPLDISGAIGQEQLKKLSGFIKQRRANAERFTSTMSDDSRFRIQLENGESSWFGFSLVSLDGTINRGALVRYLNNCNIDCRPIVAGNFLRNPVIKYFDYEVVGDCGAADEIHDNGFFVGNSHEEIGEKIDYLKTVLDQYGK